MRILVSKNSAAEADFVAARAALNVAAAAFERSKAQLEFLLDGAWEYEIATAESEAFRANAMVNQTESLN